MKTGIEQKQQENKVMCGVCDQVYEDWSGSTPCCGSLAYAIDEQGNKTNEAVLNKF